MLTHNVHLCTGYYGLGFGIDLSWALYAASAAFASTMWDLLVAVRGLG
jgi:hypothetical protein